MSPANKTETLPQPPITQGSPAKQSGQQSTSSRSSTAQPASLKREAGNAGQHKSGKTKKKRHTKANATKFDAKAGEKKKEKRREKATAFSFGFFGVPFDHLVMVVLSFHIAIAVAMASRITHRYFERSDVVSGT